MNRKYRKTVIAGNWKMNMLASEIKPFMEQLKENLPKTRACDVVLCTPAPLLPAMIKAAEGLQGRRRRTGCFQVREGRIHRRGVRCPACRYRRKVLHRRPL